MDGESSGPILRLGWDTMSSTSSGLLCNMAAASLNVTPSKLVLFSEMRRPPGKISKHLQVLMTGHVQSNCVSFSTYFIIHFHPVSIFFNLHRLSFAPGLIRPSFSAGPSGTMEAMKIPRSSLPVLSSPTITKPETGAENMKTFTKESLVVAVVVMPGILSLSAESAVINSPKPSLGSFFRVTQTISLSGGVRVGVSTAKRMFFNTINGQQ